MLQSRTLGWPGRRFYGIPLAFLSMLLLSSKATSDEYAGQVFGLQAGVFAIEITGLPSDTQGEARIFEVPYDNGVSNPELGHQLSLSLGENETQDKLLSLSMALLVSGRLADFIGTEIYPQGCSGTAPEDVARELNSIRY